VQVKFVQLTWSSVTGSLGYRRSGAPESWVGADRHTFCV